MSVVKDIDFDRKLDEVGLIALPYLVHALEPFRTELAHNMQALVHSYLRKDVGGTYTQIEASIDRVLNMIEEYRIGSLPSQENIQTIDMYAAKIQTQEDRVKQLSARLDAHIKSHKQRPKATEPAPVAGEPVPVPVIVTTVQSIADTPVQDALSTPVQDAPIVDVLKITRKKRLTSSEIEQKLELLRNYLRTNMEIDNPKAREICGLDISQAKYYLHKLVEEKFVEQKGERSRTKYVLK